MYIIRVHEIWCSFSSFDSLAILRRTWGRFWCWKIWGRWRARSRGWRWGRGSCRTWCTPGYPWNRNKANYDQRVEQREDDFDAKGNYNFDPLRQQKMSARRREGGKTQSWQEAGNEEGRGELLQLFLAVDRWLKWITANGLRQKTVKWRWRFPSAISLSKTSPGNISTNGSAGLNLITIIIEKFGKKWHLMRTKQTIESHRIARRVWFESFLRTTGAGEF